MTAEAQGQPLQLRPAQRTRGLLERKRKDMQRKEEKGAGKKGQRQTRSPFMDIYIQRIMFVSSSRGLVVLFLSCSS